MLVVFPGNRFLVDTNMLTYLRSEGYYEQIMTCYLQILTNLIERVIILMKHYDHVGEFRSLILLCIPHKLLMMIW